MADLDRITELLLSDEEMPDVYYSMLENASDTKPTLDSTSLEALIANRQAQDELLMNMAMGPKNITKSTIRKFINPKTGQLKDELYYAGKPSSQTPERILRSIPYKSSVADLKTFNPYGPKDVRNYYMSNPIKEMLMPYSRRVKITRETGIDPLSPRGPYRNIDAEAARLLKELMK